MRSWSVRFLAVAALAAGEMVASGCAQNVGDIDLTQPHRIDVSTLNDGKPWWFLQTIVDVPPTVSFTFTGEDSFPPDRIVWDVQENWLIAYRNYEFIVNSQTPYEATEDNYVNQGTPSQSPYFGTPIAAYPILSHFDVERQYNPQTGEQTNVISENTTDRPWYERQYIRVDWSNNAMGNFNFLALGGNSALLGNNQLLTTPVAYYPDDDSPTDPDRADVEDNYVSITNKIDFKAELDPDLTAYYGQPIYSCYTWQGYGGLSDCNPGEVKVRLSFEKIPADHDYVPRNYTDNDVLRFGVWQEQRAEYDPQRGYLVSDLYANQYAVMHHIWQKDHRATDPTTGQACDVNDFTNQNCILPLNERNPKPIVYYTSNTWPAIDDADHQSMWTHQALLSNDYNDDMRGVVAAAERGGPNSPIDQYIAQNGYDVTGLSAIDYSQPSTSFTRYNGAKGLDYLESPPDIRQLDSANFGLEGIRPDRTWISTDNKTLCTQSQISAGQCTLCDPSKQYCMGIGHVPYTVVPRMFMICHNPVQPRVVTWNGQTYDKSDPNAEASYDFSTPGDPDACDPRPDSQRMATPLQPLMGDLRYHMIAWVPEPDAASPGGIGEPAMDPVTGEIITSRCFIYGRAVEGWATQTADLLAVMNGWETYNNLISGVVAQNYVNSYVGQPQKALSISRLQNMVLSPGAKNLIQTTHAQAVNLKTRQADWGLSNWQALQNINIPSMNFNMQAPIDGPNGEIVKDFASLYGPSQGGQQIPPDVLQSLSTANFVAPPTINTWDSDYNATQTMFQQRHIMTDDEIEPVALRLAQYYKNKYAAQDPCIGTYTDTNGADYRTCIWEAARREILGNVWRSYTNHEVGHTFGQYHNFAASTDALNYFDPYWDLRQENEIEVNSAGADPVNCGTVQDPNNPTNTIPSNCAAMYQALGSVPNNVALAPEWIQAPSEDSLQKGLREYQYSSIMDYNANFNADYQGIGKYDHACHMYQYADTVEVFDPRIMTNVPKNDDIDTNPLSPTNGAQLYPHEVSDELLQPFNRHYTMYPWLINDGLNAKSTPLPTAIQKMLHARRWVRYDDLQGATTEINGALTDADTMARDNLHLADLQNATQVPYRFCSDTYNQGEAHCLWFDAGADQYEQATYFINEYQLDYMFHNFARGLVTQNPGDDYFTPNGYYSRLWQRVFQPLVRIGQHWINDEFVVRLGENITCPEGNATFPHYAALQCGLAGTAAAVSTVDFFTKLLQTPNTDLVGWDATNNSYCGQTTQDGCNFPSSNAGIPSTLPATLQFQPGDSSKFDISQYNLALYGQNFLYQPTEIGIWVDKMLAIQALGDYDTYFVGELNNQPLSFLISYNDFFFKDVQNAVGSLILDDPSHFPMVAVYTANPTDPAHPPLSVYHDSNALSNVAAAFGSPVNPWCPSNESWCAAAQNVTPQDPPAGYSLLTYKDVFGNTKIATIDPQPVYFEKELALNIAAIYFTTANDTQNFIQSIRVNVKGNTNDKMPAQLSCGNANTANASAPVFYRDSTPSCENGASCVPNPTTDGGVPNNTPRCLDGSACVQRHYACVVNPGDTWQSAGATTPSGSCLNPADPQITNCNPDVYSEFDDPTSQNSYWAERTTPQSGDLTDTGSPQPLDYYAPAYQAVKLSAQRANVQGPTGLNARAFLDIFREYYYYFNYGGNPGYFRSP